MKKNGKKLAPVIAAVCFALVCSLCCFGCAPTLLDDQGSNYEVNINLDKNIKAELTVLVPSTDGGVESRIIDAVAKGFKQHYPNVTVKKKADAITDEFYMETILNLVQSDTMPDLVYTNTAMYYFCVSKKVLLNLEPYFKATAKAGTLDMADYYDNFFDMATYEGGRYVIPRNADSVVTFYNKSMLSEAGINPETDERMTNDWTWDDFVSIGKQLVDFWKTNPNKYARYYPLRQTVLDWESVWNPLMQSFGANALTNGKVTIDSHEAREFVELYKNLVTEKITPSWDSGSMSQFINGYTAFEFSSSGPDYFQKIDLLKDNFEILPFPLVNGEDSKIGSGFAGWGISGKSKNRDLAWAFLQYMISEEGQLAMYSGGDVSTPSVLRSLTESKAWAKGFEHLNLDAYMAHEDKKISPAYFKSANPTCVFDIQYALQNFTRDALTPSVDTDKCIANAKSALTTAITVL